MLERWKRSLFFLVLSVGSVGEAAAELGIEFGIESSRWREFDAGARLLEESGPRYRVGANWLAPLGGDPWHALELRGSLYFGGVDYDGQACTLSGSCIPFQTDADYLGVSGEVSLIRRFGASANGEWFAGGGIDSWERDVQGRGNVSGAIENWTVFYFMGGGGARWSAAAKRYRLQAGLKYPLYTYEVAESLDVSLEPEGRLSLFARFGAVFIAAGKPRWGVGVYYDSYRFGMSDVERTGSIRVWQPQSEQDVIGVYGVRYLH